MEKGEGRKEAGDRNQEMGVCQNVIHKNWNPAYQNPGKV